jgi:hypothetical protein
MLPLAGDPSRKLANASPPDAVGVGAVNACVKVYVPAEVLKVLVLAPMRRYSAPTFSVWLPFRCEIDAFAVCVTCVVRFGPPLPNPL